MAYRQASHVFLHESAVHIYRRDSTGCTAAGLPDEERSGWWVYDGQIKAVVSAITGRAAHWPDREMPDGFQILRTIDDSFSRDVNVARLEAEVASAGLLNVRITTSEGSPPVVYVEEFTHCGAFTVCWDPAQP